MVFEQEFSNKSPELALVKLRAHFGLKNVNFAPKVDRSQEVLHGLT
jgi:hypothetical protein